METPRHSFSTGPEPKFPYQWRHLGEHRAFGSPPGASALKQDWRSLTGIIRRMLGPCAAPRSMFLCFVKRLWWHFFGSFLGLGECFGPGAGMRARKGGAARMVEGKPFLG